MQELVLDMKISTDMYRLISERLVSDVNGSITGVRILESFFLWDILLFLQTLASLRIEIDNYIIQRQRAEEQSVANVSFKCLPFLDDANAMNSFERAPKQSCERFLFVLVSYIRHTHY